MTTNTDEIKLLIKKIGSQRDIIMSIESWIPHHKMLIELFDWIGSIIYQSMTVTENEVDGRFYYISTRILRSSEIEGLRMLLHKFLEAR